jgi:hypothetical protein
MRVVIGPVDARSAAAWLGYADRVLDELGTLAPGECFSTPETVAILRDFVARWRTALGDDRLFLWDDDVPAERIEFAMHAFQRVVDVLARRAEVHGRTAPPEGDDFYLAVLQGVLSAMQAESGSSAAYADHLAEFWPGWATIS